MEEREPTGRSREPLPDRGEVKVEPTPLASDIVDALTAFPARTDKQILTRLGQSSTLSLVRAELALLDEAGRICWFVKAGKRHYFAELLSDKALACCKLLLDDRAPGLLRSMEQGPRTLAEIARAAEMPESTVHDRIKSLVERGWLEETTTDGLPIRTNRNTAWQWSADLRAAHQSNAVRRLLGLEPPAAAPRVPVASPTLKPGGK